MLPYRLCKTSVDCHQFLFALPTCLLYKQDTLKKLQPQIHTFNTEQLEQHNQMIGQLALKEFHSAESDAVYQRRKAITQEQNKIISNFQLLDSK